MDSCDDIVEENIHVRMHMLDREFVGFLKRILKKSVGLILLLRYWIGFSKILSYVFGSISNKKR